MMLDVFSPFDPFVSSPSYSPPMASPLIPFIILPILFIILTNMPLWASSSRQSNLMTLPMKIMLAQSRQTTSPLIKGFSSILAPFFLMILALNLLALTPYTFSLTSHLIFTLAFALPLWLGLVISSFSYNFSTMAASLLPSGGPPWLNPFLIMIETVSMMVRPLTLSFRLGANMTAGHIVLWLISNFLAAKTFTMSWAIIAVIFLVNIGYFLFEMAIALVQAFIYPLLLSLYSNDHPTN